MQKPPFKSIFPVLIFCFLSLQPFTSAAQAYSMAGGAGLFLAAEPPVGQPSINIPASGLARPDYRYLYLDLALGCWIDEFGCFGTNISLGAGWQFNKFAGVGLNIGAIDEICEYDERSFTGLGIQYRLNPGVFLFKAEMGLVLDYNQNSSGYPREHRFRLENDFYLKLYPGVRIFKVVTLGAVIAILPAGVEYEVWEYDDTKLDFFNTGIVGTQKWREIQPFIGVSIPIFKRKV